MARVYADLIRKGVKTIEDVPAHLRADIEALLKELDHEIREWLLKILLRKEVQTMAVVYATLIVKGKKTLGQVPARLREEMEDILNTLEVAA